MVRLNLKIPSEMKAALEAASAETGAPISELVRRFIAAGLKATADAVR